MKEFFILLVLGIGLSIDAFSVATVIGIYNLSINKIFNTSLIVGIFHFFMPLLGLIISNIINNYMPLNTKFILGVILILISSEMLLEYIKPTKKEIKLNKLGILLFSFGVSLDSFSIGFGLKAITNNLLLASTIFTTCSFSATFLGLSIGKYLNKLLKNYSYLFGTLLLFIMGVVFLCKCI